MGNNTIDNKKLRSLIREEIQKVMKSERKKNTLNENIFMDLKNLFAKAKPKVPEKTEKGKRIVGMDFDGYFIDEDGNRI